MRNSYYLGLYDIDYVDYTNVNGNNIYKKVDWRKSGNQEYFIMIDNKLRERGNWSKLTDKQVLKTSIIDFCFTNWAKLQTNSVIHNRILLDTDHFISNKWFYYDTFKNYEFIPGFMNIKNNDSLPDKITSPLILKPSTGSLSNGIKIVDCKNSKQDLIDHLREFSGFTNWSLSPIYIAKRWNDGCIVSNRIYFLVRKFKRKNELFVNGYWFDELIHYKASTKYDENEKHYEKMKKQLITNCPNGEIDAFDYFQKRVLTHEQYLSLFTEEEYEIVKNKITNYIKIITEKIANHIICSNDYLVNVNDTTSENRNMTFHLYGIDSLIMDDLSVKFIEINGAPTITYDAAINHIDYSVMIDEVLKLTVDVLYCPKYKCQTNNNSSKSGPKYGYFKNKNKLVKLFDRKFIECGEFRKSLKTPIYIARQVHNTYPFITNALFNEKRRQVYQRIKNPHAQSIFLFYGLRDRYIHKNSSLHFYDELIEYRISENGSKAKILNKIQGVTYYLASKDRLYYNCGKRDYLPKSIIFHIDVDKVDKLDKFIEDCNTENKKIRFIIKPVYGSRGKGIIIMANNENSDQFILNMKLIKKQFDYNIFIISIYIDNPKLYTEIKKNKRDIKFNMRFYAFLHINKLGCFENNNSNDINYYILKDVQIYFSVLPYNVNINEITQTLLSILNTEEQTDKYITLYEKFKSLPLNTISNLINLTNLEVVKNLAYFLNLNISLNNFVMTLDQMNFDDELKESIRGQAEYIIYDTIHSIKHNIRHINRFVKGSSAFNLIAYDTMLDDNNKLHLIEINRGPDLHGLKMTLGEEKITNIFSELFDIVIDGKTEEQLEHFTQYRLDMN